MLTSCLINFKREEKGQEEKRLRVHYFATVCKVKAILNAVLFRDGSSIISQEKGKGEAILGLILKVFGDG